MGCWGMGITQSDQYCEIYERFMEEYDEGKPVSDITADILADMLEEFAPDDGILHDVYFALAKSQWMCGGVSGEIMDRVTGIIERGANIEFYRELEASPSDLKLRQKNLTKFLAGLQTPRATVRKRKNPESAYVPVPPPTPLPKVNGGNVIAFPVGDRWRVMLLAYVITTRKESYASCFLWNDLFDEIPVWEQLENAPGILIGNVSGDVFPREFQKVHQFDPGPIWPMGQVYSRLWDSYLDRTVQPYQLLRPLPKNLCLPFLAAFQNGLAWYREKTGQLTEKYSLDGPV